MTNEPKGSAPAEADRALALAKSEERLTRHCAGYVVYPFYQFAATHTSATDLRVLQAQRDDLAAALALNTCGHHVYDMVDTGEQNYSADGITAMGNVTYCARCRERDEAYQRGLAEGK